MLVGTPTVDSVDNTKEPATKVSSTTFEARHNKPKASGGKSPLGPHDLDVPTTTVKEGSSNLGPATHKGSWSIARRQGFGQSFHAPQRRIRWDSSREPAL
jgi:hypothetical protein